MKQTIKELIENSAQARIVIVPISYELFKCIDSSDLDFRSSELIECGRPFAAYDYEHGLDNSQQFVQCVLDTALELGFTFVLFEAQ